MIGYWSFSFAPREGGYNDLTLNVLHGPSETTLGPLPGSVKPTGLSIETSAKDDFIALSAAFRLKDANLPYDVLGNNCAHMSRAVIKAAGIDLGNPLFDTPGKLRRDLEQKARVK